MDPVLALLDQLDDQLDGATALAATRAEHLRLIRLRTTAAQLREQLVPLAESA